jgi:hypothetical protein
MDQSPERTLKLALHRFLDLCRDARLVGVNAEIRTWLDDIELHAWACLAKYRFADPAQQSRLLEHCVTLERKVRRLTGIYPSEGEREAA